MFKFKLETILSLREKVEESKKRELGSAVAEEEQLNAQKRRLQEEKAATSQRIKACHTDQVDLASLKMLHQYRLRMDREIETKEKACHEARQQVMEKREELLKALKDRKILENLKAIEKEVYIEEEKREEQRQIDDRVTYQYGVKGKEPSKGEER